MQFSSSYFNTYLDGQTYRHIFQDTPLSEALCKPPDNSQVKVAFDSRKLGAVKIDKEVTGNTPNEFIADLLLNSGFNYRYKYNRYLIIESDSLCINSSVREYQVIGSVSDRETGEHLPYATIILNETDYMVVLKYQKTEVSGIKNVYTNPVRLLVSFIGYNHLDTTVSLTDPSMNIDIRLDRKTLVLDSIIVKGRRLEMVDMRNDVDCHDS